MLETLGEVLPASARRFGDKTALVIGGRRFTFNELNALSNRLANGLRATSGSKRGTASPCTP